MDESLKQLARVFGADRLLKPEDVQTILKSIGEVLSVYKKDTISLNEDTKKLINDLLGRIVNEHNRYLEETDKLNKGNKKELKDLANNILKQIEAVQVLCKEVMESKPENGEDADEEYIIEEVLKRIDIPKPEEVVFDIPELVNSINNLPNEDRFKIDAKQIKNLPEGKVKSISGGVTRKIVQQMIAESGAAGITLQVGGTPNVNQGLLNLVAGSNMTITDNGDGSVTFASTGGSGSGDVVGPASATDNAIVRFDTTTGKLIQNSGVTISDANIISAAGLLLSGLTASQMIATDASKNLVSLSTATYPSLTELAYLKGATSAIQTQIDTKITASSSDTLTNKTINASNNTISNITTAMFAASVIDTDVNLAADSDTRIATQKAVKAYVSSAVTGLLDLKGDTDCSTNPNYPSALKGDAYYVTVAGKIGGASGKTVEVGDVYVAKADNAGGTEASVGTSWFVLNQNLSGVALTSSTLAQFASTTSAQLAGVISDETGSGSLVFGTDPTFTTRINTPEVKATSSAGISFKNSSGTETILTGAGGGTGTSIVGTTNIGSASADYIQIAGGTGSTTQTATGSSSNIDINLVPKGTGIVKGELKRFMVRLVEAATDQATGTAIGGDYRISNRAITIKAVGSYCDTAGTTGTYTVDINEAGTTILSTKITVDSTEKSSETAATAPVISDASIAADAIVTFDVDAVQTTKAKGLVVWVDYVYA
jgi:hypothetical protein